jgi:hypothetical protein
MDFHYVESFVIHDSGITCPKAEASNGKGDPGPKTMGIWLGMRRNWDLDGFGTFIDQLGYLSVINQFTWWASADMILNPKNEFSRHRKHARMWIPKAQRTFLPLLPQLLLRSTKPLVFLCLTARLKLTPVELSALGQGLPSNYHLAITSSGWKERGLETTNNTTCQDLSKNQ